MEERVARLESQVEHIQSDLTDIKADLRRLNERVDSMDQSLGGKIEAGDTRLSAKIDAAIAAIATLSTNMERGFAKQARWALLLYIAMGAALLKIIAAGFRWIS